MRKIRIVSPAKQIEEFQIEEAVHFLTKQKFLVEVGDNAAGKYHYFSGTEKERLADFQAALDDETVDIILCTRGGYGAIHLIDKLDFTLFLKQPKLIVGYSDVTVFHNHVVSHFGVETLHATVPLNFKENTPEALKSLVNAMNLESNEYTIAPHALNVLGNVKAEVVGGNLAIIYGLIGTNSDINLEGKILFIEEIGEAVYSIDRMFYALKKAGKLDQIKGLIVGGITGVKDSEIPYGKTVEEIIVGHLLPLNVPVCFNFPAGHIDDNRAIVMGRMAQLSIREHEVRFLQ